MSGALPFLIIGLLLVVLLAVWALRARDKNHSLTESCENDKRSNAFYPEAPPQRLAHRLFGAEDWNFINTQGSEELRRLFLQQRTTLALSWLHAVRMNAKRLILIHRTSARTNSRLEPVAELKVAVDYFLFLILCQFVAMAISVRGPIHWGRLITYTGNFSSRLQELIARAFPAELASESNNQSQTMPWERGG